MECLTWWHYNIFQLTMNLSTDLILLLVPITLISGLNMKIGKYVLSVGRDSEMTLPRPGTRVLTLPPLVSRKLLLICLFSMGVFVVGPPEASYSHGRSLGSNGDPPNRCSAQS